MIFFSKKSWKKYAFVLTTVVLLSAVLYFTLNTFQLLVIHKDITYISPISSYNPGTLKIHRQDPMKIVFLCTGAFIIQIILEFGNYWESLTFNIRQEILNSSFVGFWALICNLKFLFVSHLPEELAERIWHSNAPPNIQFSNYSQWLACFKHKSGLDSSHLF